jgi:hypothetical protein
VFFAFLDVANNFTTVDFALTEAAYAVVRILQEFPQLRIPLGDRIFPTGKEPQTVTLVLKIRDGCRVEI